MTILYEHITTDKRHRNCRILMTYEDNGRIFPNWLMGLVTPDDKELKMNDLLSYLQANSVKLKDSREKLISILRRFNS